MEIFNYSWHFFSFNEDLKAFLNFAPKFCKYCDVPLDVLLKIRYWGKSRNKSKQAQKRQCLSLRLDHLDSYVKVSLFSVPKIITTEVAKEESTSAQIQFSS